MAVTQQQELEHTKRKYRPPAVKTVSVDVPLGLMICTPPFGYECADGACTVDCSQCSFPEC